MRPSGPPFAIHAYFNAKGARCGANTLFAASRLFSTLFARPPDPPQTLFSRHPIIRVHPCSSAPIEFPVPGLEPPARAPLEIHPQDELYDPRPRIHRAVNIAVRGRHLRK